MAYARRYHVGQRRAGVMGRPTAIVSGMKSVRLTETGLRRVIKDELGRLAEAEWTTPPKVRQLSEDEVAELAQAAGLDDALSSLEERLENVLGSAAAALALAGLLESHAERWRGEHARRDTGRRAKDF